MQPGLHAFAQKSCFSGWGRVRFFFFLYRNWKKKRCDTQSKLPNIKYIQDIAHAYFDAQNVTEILV